MLHENMTRCIQTERLAKYSLQCLLDLHIEIIYYNGEVYNYINRNMHDMYIGTCIQMYDSKG